MELQLIYYIEVNAIAIWICAIIIRQIYKHTSHRETSNIVFHSILGLIIVMCASDIVGLASEGQSFAGSRIVVYIANAIYFATQAAICYSWMLFFQVRVRRIKKLISLRTFIGASPLIGFICVLLANPWTKWFFYVDENSRYFRGDYVYIHWIIEFFYVILIIALIISRFITTSNKVIRSECVSFITYFIPVIIAGYAQIKILGVSSLQIGIVIASLMVYQQIQDNQITRDELTGLNNRRSLYNHEVGLTSHESGANAMLFMIDVDKFKSINDTFGHLKGDDALIEVASILRKSLSNLPGNRLVLYRYAGDEFVILGANVSHELINIVKTNIEKELEKSNKASKEPFILSLSVGVATMHCKTLDDFSKLLEKADADMYETKQAKKKLVVINKP